MNQLYVAVVLAVALVLTPEGVAVAANHDEARRAYEAGEVVGLGRNGSPDAPVRHRGRAHAQLWVPLRNNIVQLIKPTWEMVRGGMWRRTFPRRARETQT